MTLPPPHAPLEVVTSPAQAIALLCRERPLEFRLVTGTLTELLNADPPQVLNSTMLLLESGHGASWSSTGVWMNPVTFAAHAVPDWSLCEPVASVLDELGIDWVAGTTRKRPDNERHFWAIYPNGRAPILNHSFSQAVAAVIAYAELIRQRVTS